MVQFLTLFFGVSSTPSSYMILCNYFLFLCQVFFFLIGLLIIFDYIFWAFSSKRNLYSISASQAFTSTLDTLFVLSISFYIIFMMLSSIGFVYNYSEVITGYVYQSELISSLTASQWYWNIELASNILNPYTLCSNYYHVENISVYSISEFKRNESVESIIVPVNTYILFKGTSTDVIHSFGIPASGLKFDCIPGRTQYAYAIFTKEGTYDAHCYELCGANHSSMQFSINVVSKKEYYSYMLLQGLKDYFFN